MFEMETDAVVISPVAGIYDNSTKEGILGDEMLCGTWAHILEDAGEWVYLRAAHRYEGWCSSDCLCCEPDMVARWRWGEKLLVVGSCVDLQKEPRVRSRSIATLLRGSLVEAAGEAIGGWQLVRTAGGDFGYIKSLHIIAYPAGSWLSENALRLSICRMAESYLGSCYRWGGKTPMGVDCSGLVSQVYLNHGIIIYRDGELREGYAVHKIKEEQALSGDLLYFKGHIAMYLGDGQYIHANATAGGVSINSLDPQSDIYRSDLAKESVIHWGSVF